MLEYWKKKDYIILKTLFFENNVLNVQHNNKKKKYIQKYITVLWCLIIHLSILLSNIN